MTTPALPRPTIGALRRLIADTLARAGIDGGAGNPGLDARLLVAHALGCTPGDVVLRDALAVDARQAAVAMALAARRAAGEPVARILGKKEFWSLELALAPETLVPRADTETVVEAALAAVDRGLGRGAALAIADLGTGSGAILLALLSELPRAWGIGVDISVAAVRTANGNAARLGLGNRAHFVAGDWGAPLGRGFDMVVANPPYVARGDIASLAVEVRGHEPHIALNGGDDGLNCYRVVLPALRALMKRDGAAFVEVGNGQDEAVGALLSAREFAFDRRYDLAGVARVLEVTRRKERRNRFRGEAELPQNLAWKSGSKTLGSRRAAPDGRVHCQALGRGLRHRALEAAYRTHDRDPFLSESVGP